MVAPHHQYSKSQPLSVGIFFACFPSKNRNDVARVAPWTARFLDRLPKISLSVISIKTPNSPATRSLACSNAKASSSAWMDAGGRSPKRVPACDGSSGERFRRPVSSPVVTPFLPGCNQPTCAARGTSLTDDIISEYQPVELGRTAAQLVLAAKVGPHT